MRRSKKLNLSPTEKEGLLKSLEQGRNAAVRVSAAARINSNEYRAAQDLINGIDRLAVELGCANDHFHLKGHG